jgi:hypothetical protein
METRNQDGSVIRKLSAPLRALVLALAEALDQLERLPELERLVDRLGL